MDPSPVIFDRRLLRERRARALALGPSTFLLERVADDMADRLGAVLRPFDRALDLGTPGDGLRRVLAASGKVERIVDAVAFDERSESTRLNSSHQIISYAVFCLKKKKHHQ